MESQWDIFRQRDFTGGENRKLLAEFLQPNQLTMAQNCVLTAEGLIESRLGKSKVNLTSLGAGPVLAIFRYAKEGGSKYLVVQHGTSLYAAAWDGASQIADFGTAVKTGLTASKPLAGVVWKDQLILTNGADVAFRFDGTACTNLGGTPPLSKIVKVYASRLWLVDVANPNQIRYCDLENYDSWPALNIIKLRDGDGDFITALSPQTGGLLLVKNRSIWPLYGTDSATIRIPEPISSIGCPAGGAFLDEGLFLGLDNWYWASLAGIEPLPETHTPLLGRLTAAQKAAVFAVGLPEERKALFALPDEVVVMDGKYNGITTWTDLNAACFAAAKAAGDAGTLLIGDKTVGQVYALTNEANDDGTAIQTFIKLSYLDYGSPREKVWRSFLPTLQVLGEAANYEIFARYDVDRRALTGQTSFAGDLPNYLEWGEDAWGEAVWGTGSDLKEPYWLHGIRGDTVSFELRTDNRISLKGYEVKYRLAGGF